MENEAQMNVTTTIDHIVNKPNEYKDELMENEAQVNVITTIDHIVNEFNSTKDKMQIEPVGDTKAKIVYDSKWFNDVNNV